MASKGSMLLKLRDSLIAPVKSENATTIGLYAAGHVGAWLVAFGLTLALVIRNDMKFNKPFGPFFWGGYAGVIGAIVAALLSVFISFDAVIGKISLKQIIIALAPSLAAVVSAGAFGMVSVAINDVEIDISNTTSAPKNPPFSDTDWNIIVFFALAASVACAILLFSTRAITKQRASDLDSQLANYSSLVNILVFISLYTAKLVQDLTGNDDLTSKQEIVGLVALVSGLIAVITLAYNISFGYSDQKPNWLLSWLNRGAVSTIYTTTLVLMLTTFQNNDMAPFAVYSLFFALAANTKVIQVAAAYKVVSSMGGGDVSA
jgi:hypothetical protein